MCDERHGAFMCLLAPLPQTSELMAGTSFKDLVAGDVPVLVDVFADWCGPCKAMGPELQALSSSVGEQAKILKVNIDRNQPLAQAYGIRSVPTLMIFKQGEMVWKAAGYHSEAQMKQALAPFMN
jgi:thioredoxin 1